jgi:hypothetical protein
MNSSGIKLINSRRSSKLSRPLFPSLLRAFGAAAFALAIFVGSALAAGNLVANGSFEKDTNGDGVPNNWLGYQLTPGDKRVCNKSYSGACSFKFVGDGTEKHIQQDLSLSGSSGEQYKLTLFMKGKDLVNGSGFTSANVLWFPSGADTIFLPGGTNAWTQYSLVVTAPSDFTAVIIRLETTATSGKAWLDKVKFVPYGP